ncbi:MAG: TRAP transporter substrate-binding protein DctP [Pseudolabrys sp.]|nr:TRAP transporter substrate-binding protein DctP [Pseudolabrys sp.]
MVRATLKHSLILAGMLAISTAPSSVRADDESLESLMKSTSVAQDWANGKLADYNAPPVTYTGAPITIRLTNHQPEVSAQVKFLKQSFAVLEKMSNGKLKVEARWNGTVHKVSEGFDANRSGLTDMAACFTFLNTASFPLTEALSLPGLFPNEAVMSLVAEKLAEKYFRAEFEKQGVYLNGITGSTRFNLFSNKPIKTLEDLKGLKVRSGTGISQRAFESLGAVPVNMSSADFFSALQRGLLDAVFTSDTAARTFRINEAAKQHTDTRINNLPLEWCMNRRTYDALPADLQKVFYVWSRQNHQADTQVAFMLSSAQARDQFKKEGIVFNEIAPDEWKRWEARFEPVLEDYIKTNEAKGLPARQLVADIRELVKKYGKMSMNELMMETIKNPVMGVSPLRK